MSEENKNCLGRMRGFNIKCMKRGGTGRHEQPPNMDLCYILVPWIACGECQYMKRYGTDNMATMFHFCHLCMAYA